MKRILIIVSLVLALVIPVSAQQVDVSKGWSLKKQQYVLAYDARGAAYVDWLRGTTSYGLVAGLNVTKDEPAAGIAGAIDWHLYGKVSARIMGSILTQKGELVDAQIGFFLVTSF